MKLAADKDGVVQLWDSQMWGTGGIGGGGVSVNTVLFVSSNLRTSAALPRQSA